MLTILKREFLAYFRTPTGYIFICTFSALSGLIFYLYNIQNLSGDLLTFLNQLTLLMMLLCPLLTMRLFSEERQKHSDVVIMTAPIPISSIVAGKYLAASLVLLITIALLNVYTLVIILFGRVFAGEWFVGFLGFTLQGLAFIAIDLFVTCFASTQVIGAVLAFAVNFILWLIDLLAGQFTSGWLKDTFEFLSLYKQSEPFRLGQFSPASIVFYLSVIIIFLSACVWVLTMRRLSERGQSR